MLYVEVISSKTKDEIKEAILKIFEKSGVPDKVLSDKGLEFTSQSKLFAEKKVYFRAKKIRGKAALIEGSFSELCHVQNIIKKVNK
jgi:hypothetical protein